MRKTTLLTLPILLLGWCLGLGLAQAPLPSPINGGGGGSSKGTVTSVATTCGTSGGTITTTGTISGTELVNAQTGTTYTVVTGDCGKMITFTQSATTAITLPQCGSAGFAAGWYSDMVNEGTATATITPTTSTIDGSSSLQILSNKSGVRVVCDGTNYFTIRGAIPTITPQLHSVVFAINGASGGAITTGALGVFPTSKYSCTISQVDVTGTPSGSITVDIWKAAGAIPTGASKISASAPATLSSSAINLGGSISGWTTGVSSGDVFGGTIATASTVTAVTITIWCQGGVG